MVDEIEQEARLYEAVPSAFWLKDSWEEARVRDGSRLVATRNLQGVSKVGCAVCAAVFDLPEGVDGRRITSWKCANCGVKNLRTMSA